MYTQLRDLPFEEGEVQKSKQTGKYVRRRHRQNVTMGGQPATPFEALRTEVLIVQVLGYFLEILHVGSVGLRKSQTINRFAESSGTAILPPKAGGGRLVTAVSKWDYVIYTVLSTHKLHHSHQHDPQFEEIIVLRVLHLHHSPRVQTTSDLFPFGLNLLVGTYHCKWDASLEKRSSSSYLSCFNHTPWIIMILKTNP